MKITFLSVGKPHEPYVKPGVDDFTKRISRYYKVDWLLIPAPKNAAAMSEPELKKKEGEIILQGLNKEDYLVALEERGKQVSSEGLASLIQARGNESVRNLVFLIGGAYGLDEAVLKRRSSNGAFQNWYFPINWCG